MSILFVATSAADFEITGTPILTTTATQKGLFVSEGFSFGNNSAGQFAHGKFAATAEIWTSFDGYSGSITTGNADSTWLEWGNSVSPGVNQPLFRLKANTTGATNMDIWNGTTWVTGATVPYIFNVTQRQHFDVHIKMHDTTGIFTIYKDGILVGSHTATDTILTAATTLDWMRHRSPGQSFGVSYFLSAIIIADEDTRAMTVAQSLPTGAGANSAWTGLFSAIDETQFDDTDFIQSDVLNAVSTFATPILPAAVTGGVYSVVAVAISGRMLAKSGRDIALTLYTNTATYPAAAGVDAPISFNARETIWHTNPATSTTWTASEASTSQIGAKIINHA
jgi:hypothetical protein